MKRLVSISVTTREWEEGDHVWFDLCPAPDASVTVSWGDGTQSACTQYDNGVWRRVEHRYGCKGMARPFQIEIWADDENGLTGIIDGAWEMVTESVVVESAPGLRVLVYHNAKAFDFGGCPNLQELECDSYRQETIDLDPLISLQRLWCRYSALARLDIGQLPKLQELDVTACGSLRKIKVGNSSYLNKLILIRVALDVHSGRWLRKTVADNGGVIIDDGHNRGTCHLAI